MHRRSFLSLCAGGLVGATSVFSAGSAFADGYESAVVGQLRRQGYRQINVERTLLGRVRIVAQRGGGSREIILNPRTGEILRDVVLAADGQVAPLIAGEDDSGKGSSGKSGSGDDGAGDGESGDDGSDGGGSDSGDSGDGESGDGESGGGESGDGDSGDSGSGDSGDDS